MECPRCGKELLNRSINEIEVHECDKCEGIWFAKDELRKVKDKADSDLNWMDFDILKHKDRFKAITTEYNCSLCKKPMNILDYDTTKVKINFCAQCEGIWLDKKVLNKLINALEEELLTKSLGDYTKATLKEAKEILTGPETFLSEWKDFTTILRLLQYRILSLKPTVIKSLVTFQGQSVE